MKTYQSLIIATALGAASVSAGAESQKWKRHVIDDTHQRAIDLQTGEVNGDGHPDLIVAFRDGGAARVYLNPGPLSADTSWPAVTIGTLPNLTGAKFHSFQQAGRLDAVAIVGGYKNVLVPYFAPPGATGFMNTSGWRGNAIPASARRQSWTVVTPLQVDGRNGIDLVAGGRGRDAQIGWFEVPQDPRKVADYRYHRLRNVGWLQDLEIVDMDRDGDLDILFTDRTGRRSNGLTFSFLGQPVATKPSAKETKQGRPSGCFWLENPGVLKAGSEKWKNHAIGGRGREVLRFQRADFDHDGLEDVLIAMRPRKIMLCKRLDPAGRNWERTVLRLPRGTGLAEDVGYADLDLDGRCELIVTSSRPHNARQGVFRLVRQDANSYTNWKLEPISGRRQVAYGPVKLFDLDHDGDLDVLTVEDGERGGVVWFENPVRSQPKSVHLSRIDVNHTPEAYALGTR